MTAEVRRFLVQLAALELDAHDTVVQRFAEIVQARSFAVADETVGNVIERSGRTDARDALAGPLLQLVRLHEPAEELSTQHETSDAAEQMRRDTSASDAAPVLLDPIAEPALAALLALLVRDLLSSETFDALYAPFREIIPVGPATA